MSSGPSQVLPGRHPLAEALGEVCLLAFSSLLWPPHSWSSAPSSTCTASRSGRHRHSSLSDDWERVSSFEGLVGLGWAHWENQVISSSSNPPCSPARRSPFHPFRWRVHGPQGSCVYREGCAAVPATETRGSRLRSSHHISSNTRPYVNAPIPLLKCSFSPAQVLCKPSKLTWTAPSSVKIPLTSQSRIRDKSDLSLSI